MFRQIEAQKRGNPFRISSFRNEEQAEDSRSAPKAYHAVMPQGYLTFTFTVLLSTLTELLL